METTNVTLRMEKGLKESADQLFNSLGLSFSSAVNLFVRKALRTQSIPFAVSMSNAETDDSSRLMLLEELLASPEALEKLSAIGRGTPYSYNSISSVEEAEKLVDSLRE